MEILEILLFVMDLRHDFFLSSTVEFMQKFINDSETNSTKM